MKFVGYLVHGMVAKPSPFEVKEPLMKLLWLKLLFNEVSSSYGTPGLKTE